MNRLSKMDIDMVVVLFNMFKNTFENSYNKINKDKGLRIEIPYQLEKDILRAVFIQYNLHAQRYKLKVLEVCPYKILAWSGYILAERVYNSSDEESQTFAIQSISSAIVSMLKLLREEGVCIEESFHKKALEMVLCEIRCSSNADKQDTRFGLGMNGFYMMFRTASVCQRVI